MVTDNWNQMSGSYCTTISPPSSPGPDIDVLKDISSQERRSNLLINHLVQNLLENYGDLLEPVASSRSKPIQPYEIVTFIHCMLLRSRASERQFLSAYDLTAKFLDSCRRHDINYLQFLHYDIRKAITACMLFSHYKCQGLGCCPYYLYSRMTGLSEEEIRNICRIVGLVLQYCFRSPSEPDLGPI
ncbi:HHL198Cp [Eremothecium sinecaudum]|uniref:HHL198Cp n=1 Tax=Eremothecium sinecaudum TaxID=45286 RepID=A0A0X8HW55_9SACH|nr:HHL198Cp [Eremothecium sinecaudum]AMD22572.1 HHL198Cp [Eremothecium sinecaudum]